MDTIIVIMVLSLALAGAAVTGWTRHARLLRRELHRAWALLDAARPADYERAVEQFHRDADASGEDVYAPEVVDHGTMVLEHNNKRSHVHIRGVFGDGGENEGVLSVSAVLDASPYFPEQGLIIVGSPTTSPLIEGYIPDLKGFSCGPEGAERLIAALQNAVRDVRAGRVAWKGSGHDRG